MAIYATASDLNALDAYTRQRLRKCMIHGHSSVRRAFAMAQKWDIQYFCTIGLIPANWLFYNQVYGYTIEQYIETQTKNQ